VGRRDYNGSWGDWNGGGGCVDWIRLAQYRDRWQAVVSAVMNHWVLAPQSWSVSLVSIVCTEMYFSV
jgi:hypothetical protein